MNCFYHPNEQAVATCPQCGKGLCAACAQKWPQSVCDNCAQENITLHIANRKKPLVTSIVILAVSLAIGLIMSIAEGDFSMMNIVFAGLGVVLIVNGWSVLTKIQPSMFLFLPIIGWVIYFVIKALISYFVGIVAFPLNIYHYFRDKKDAEELQSRIHI